MLSKARNHILLIPAIYFLLSGGNALLGLLNGPEYNNCEMVVRWLGGDVWEYSCPFECAEENGEAMDCIFRTAPDYETNWKTSHIWCDCPSWNVSPSSYDNCTGSWKVLEDGSMVIDCQDFGCKEKGPGFVCGKLDPFPIGEWVHPCTCKEVPPH